MLNEIELSKILETEIPKIIISDIHWKAQDSNENSILFYKLTNLPQSEELFTQRLGTSQFAWLILNKDHPGRPLNSTIIPDEKWPIIQEAILNCIYPLPPLKLIALTGTNGKTTTTDLVLQLGELLGKKGLSIGTLGVRSQNQTILDFGLTSPSLIDLRKYLMLYGKDKDFCVLEASSHALIQNRLYGLKFDMAGWLSFSQDHLDYHQTMEEYFSAKLLIKDHLSDEALLFIPTEQEKLLEAVKQVTIKASPTQDISSPLPLFFSTKFNRNNLEVAVSIVKEVFKSVIKPELFFQILPPAGRFYIRSVNSSFIVVDFAHTPDALDNICQGIRTAFPEHELKVLFGCGGDRDKTKRPLMGKIAETWAKKIYVTSDNPRFEDPAQIIQDILAGISEKKVTSVIDRKSAVALALSELNPNEVLLIAGKGHEDYLLINGVKHPYSDIREVDEFLEGKEL